MIRHPWYSHDHAIRHDGTPVPSNYAVPRYAYRVQHAHTPYEAIVLATLERNAHPLVGHGGKDLGKVCMMSVPKIAAACWFPGDTDRPTGMPVGTVRKVLRRLHAKHSALMWNVGKATAEPRRRGDHGGMTAWRIPTFEQVLEARRNDPNIGKSGDGKMFVIGRGRRFLTQAELDSWAINPAAVQAAGAKAMPAEADIEQAVTSATTESTKEAALAPSPPEARARPSPAPDTPAKPGRPPAKELEPIREALATVCASSGLGAGDDDAWFVFQNARSISHEIPIEGIAQVVAIIARAKWKNDSHFEFRPGFFSGRVLDGPVREWKEKQRRQHLEQAKQAKWDRAHRVTFLMEAMGAIADAATNPDTGWDEQDLAYYRERIAEADPQERTEATAAYERSRDYAAGLRASRAG